MTLVQTNSVLDFYSPGFRELQTLGSSPEDRGRRGSQEEEEGGGATGGPQADCRSARRPRDGRRRGDLSQTGRKSPHSAARGCIGSSSSREHPKCGDRVGIS